MSKSLRNLRFLQRRHKLTGFDSDYLMKLNEEELAWLESFARKYYNGEGEEDPKRKKEANHRRYMAKSADAMSKSSGLLDSLPAPSEHADAISDASIDKLKAAIDCHNTDDLTPERILLLTEPLPTPTRHLRLTVRSPDETVEEKT